MRVGGGVCLFFGVRGAFLGERCLFLFCCGVLFVFGFFLFFKLGIGWHFSIIKLSLKVWLVDFFHLADIRYFF